MRFKTVDGLRGIAALAVVFFHLNAALVRTYGDWAPAWIQTLFAHGYLGVDVFFVISGFVIAYSIRNAVPSLGFLGRFGLRRSIRLDPPYWAAIFLEIGAIWLGLRLGLADAPLPSTPQVVSHFVYLQNLLGYGDIVDIFWTLCFEIQFYLGLVLLLLLHRKLEQQVGPRPARVLGTAALASLFLISVAARYGVFGVHLHPGFALIRWFQFFLGVCVFRVVVGRNSWRLLIAPALVIVAAVLAQGQQWYQLLPIGVAGLLLWAYRRDQMTVTLSNRFIQFLGAISYSFYLFHATIGWRLIRALGMWLGPAVPRPLLLVLFIAAVGICILVAWIAWMVLERPALRLSRWIRLGGEDRESGQPATAPVAAASSFASDKT